jgi:acyl-CoA synthetase (AMP-forming)/AMP-acid ligase II
LTTNQLLSKANNLAVALLKKGITKSDIICCHSENNIPYAILIFAAHFLGITVTSAKPKNNIYELENQIINSRSTIVFTSVANAHISEKVLQKGNVMLIKWVFVFDGNYSTFTPFDDLFNSCIDEKLERIPYFDINPRKDICIIAYTSGTTGNPKGAILSHYSFVASLKTFLKLENESQDVVPSCYPFGHISGTLLTPLWISRGTTVIIHNKADEENILSSIEKYRATVLPLFQSFGYKLIEGPLVDKYDLSSVKTMFHGATHFPANIAKALVDKYKVRFVECKYFFSFNFQLLLRSMIYFFLKYFNPY